MTDTTDPTKPVAWRAKGAKMNNLVSHRQNQTFTEPLYDASLLSEYERVKEERDEAVVFKAKAVSRGKLLERFRDCIMNMTDTAVNEGDRVYFGSTNDFEQLREIGQQMDRWNWDAIIRERPEIDPYADARAARQDARAATARSEALEAENKRLREALLPFSRMAGEMFARNWNAKQIVTALDNPERENRVTAGDFFKARAALEASR